MTKEEHVAWWREEAQRAWDTAVYLMNGKRYVDALFFFHLAVEKHLKANWAKDNISNTPPFSHDLGKLYLETDLNLPNGWYDYLGTLTPWNIEARYPDYRKKWHAIADSTYVQEHYEKLCTLKALLESASSMPS